MTSPFPRPFPGPTSFGDVSSVGLLLGSSETTGMAIDFATANNSLLIRNARTTVYRGPAFDGQGGPLSFTRASNATVTDSDGVIKWAPHNLLTNSESFDAAAWAKNHITSVAPTVVANDGAAPNGTTTADKVGFGVIDAAGDVSSITQSFTAEAVSYTGGFWIKGFTAGDVGKSVSVYLNDGTLKGQIFVTVTADWQYVTTSAVLTSGAGRSFHVSTVGSTYGGANQAAVTVYLWGAHLYRSDLAMQANTSAYPMYNPTTPKNLLGSTEDFSAAAWTNAAPDTPTVTSNNLVAPNGIATGDTLTAATGGIASQLRQSLSAAGGKAYTFSVYIKQGTSTQSRILVRDATNSLNFLQTTGLTWSSGVPVIAAGIGTWATPISVGDGWWRVSGTGTAGAGATVNVLVSIYPDNSAGTGTLGVWGAQLSDSASLDSYVPVYGAAVTSAAYYGPRRDFDPVTLACKGLLVEEQRANLFINSNAPTALTGVTVTANAAVSPDGTSNAYRIAKTDATDPRYIQRPSSMTTVAARTYTVSAWFKYDGFNTTVSLEYNNTANWDLSWVAQFTVASTGVTTLSAVSCTQSVQNVGNGWYRAIVTFTAGAAPTVTSNPSVLTRVTGASGVTVLGYGGQIEENASFATSYIPTGAATATRNADVASVSTQAFPYSATESSIVANFVPMANGYTNIVQLSAANTPFGLLLYQSIASSAAYVDAASTSLGLLTIGATEKIGIAYNGSSNGAVRNGGTVSSVGTTVSATATKMGIGSGFNGGGTFNGHIRQITYLPRRISNAELQTRTA